MAKDKTIPTFDISERIAILGILNDFKGKLEDLAVVLEDIKKVPITDEEWVAAERVIVPIEGKDEVQWKWNDDKGGLKALDFNTITANFIKKVIKEKSDKGEVTLKDKVFITLQAKLS